MGTTIQEFAAQCHAALKADPGTEGRKKIRDLLKKVLAEPGFADTYITDSTSERDVLYEDPEFGFTILAHNNKGPKGSSPHDHGPSWAIYGQASGETIMTDWECLARPTETTPGKAKRIRDYVMRPGDAYFYDVGVLHSPERKAATRLIRIEGMNMARVKRRPYEVVELSPAAE